MICVIAKLTPDATERLNILRKAVVSEKPPVKPFYGHITIATYLHDTARKILPPFPPEQGQPVPHQLRKRLRIGKHCGER